ncbi:PAS-domain containing protein [Stappia albiluteola]|uniref:PAS-domain containing protein n=1 Tax=Stappia albiluteola TaxID=2758565 RepID=UPI001AD8C980|nr:PAS-domain containing protein [Stappia albiluteola]
MPTARETDADHARLDVLQAALDHINQGFSVFDAELNLLAWNRGLFEMLDLPLWLARRGMPLEDFFRVIAGRGEYGPGDIETMVRRRLERAALFESHSFERVRPNGQVILVAGAPLPQGGFVTTYTDVTHERRHQANLEQTVLERTRALRQSEDWLRLVTDNVPALIAYLGPGPVFRFANRAYAKWFGHTPVSIIGRTAEEVAGPELFPDLAPHFARAFDGHAVSYEYARKLSTGRLAHMRSTLIPDRTLDGRTLGCFVLSLDITDQKRSEAALAQAQRMEAVGQLSGGLAHDFNNLLTIVTGNTLALKRLADEPAMPDLAVHLDPILHAAERGADLTRRLLAFARGDEGRQDRIRLAGLLSNVGRLLSASLPRTVAIETEIADAALEAVIDAAEVENALINLAFNARDAMPDGGTLKLCLSRRDLDENQAASLGLSAGLYAEILVCDTGSGMNEETLRQAFDPFFTTKAFGTGSGLGLPTVYGIVARTGGGIDIESKKDSGTKVRMLLPATEGARASGDGSEAPEPIAAGELVLLVDDEHDVAEVVRDQLCALGFSVLVSNDPADALDLVREVDEIRAVLSDIVMPGRTSGTAFAETLRSLRPDLPVALMSGYRQAGGGRALEEIACPVLEKPFTTRMLAQTMSEILAHDPS